MTKVREIVIVTAPDCDLGEEDYLKYDSIRNPMNFNENAFKLANDGSMLGKRKLKQEEPFSGKSINKNKIQKVFCLDGLQPSEEDQDTVIQGFLFEKQPSKNKSGSKVKSEMKGEDIIMDLQDHPNKDLVR